MCLGLIRRRNDVTCQVKSSDNRVFIFFFTLALIYVKLTEVLYGHLSFLSEKRYISSLQVRMFLRKHSIFAMTLCTTKDLWEFKIVSRYTHSFGQCEESTRISPFLHIVFGSHNAR